MMYRLPKSGFGVLSAILVTACRYAAPISMTMRQFGSTTQLSSGSNASHVGSNPGHSQARQFCNQKEPMMDLACGINWRSSFVTTSEQENAGAGHCSDDTDRIEVNGATVTVGDTTIVVTGDDADPASLDHTSVEDGYAAFKVNGENVTLRFLPGDSHE